MFKRSLALRIFAINIILLLLPMILILGFFFTKSRQETIESLLFHLRDLSLSRAGLISDHVAFKERLLTILVDQLGLTNPETVKQEELAKELRKLVHDTPAIGTITYTTRDKEGRFILTASSLYSATGSDMSHYYFIQSAVTNHQNMSLGYGPANNPWLFVTRVIMDKEDNILGTLTIASQPTSLLTSLMSTKYLYLDMSFSLVTKDGLIFTSSNPGFISTALAPLVTEDVKRLYMEKESPITALRILLPQPICMKGFTDIFSLQDANATLLGILLPIEGSDATFMSTINRDELFAPVYGYLYNSFLILFLAACMTSLFIWLLVKRLAQPLQQLEEVIHQVDAGHLERRFRKDSVGYELNTIGEAINQMMDSIQATSEKQKNEELKAETTTQEIKMTHQIKQRLLPHNLPLIDNIAMAIYAKPAAEGKGDFYDLFLYETPDKKRKLAITVAHAEATGLTASLYALTWQSMLHGFLVSLPTLDEALQHARQLFYQNKPQGSAPITLFSALLDLETWQLTYHTAGHTPTFLKQVDGILDTLATEGSPLGATSPDAFSCKAVKCQRGDLLILSTCGIINARNKEGALFTEEHLRTFLESPLENSPDTMVRQLKEELARFTSGAEQKDDITLVIIKFGPSQTLVSTDKAGPAMAKSS